MTKAAQHLFFKEGKGRQKKNPKYYYSLFCLGLSGPLEVER